VVAAVGEALQQGTAHVAAANNAQVSHVWVSERDGQMYCDSLLAFGEFGGRVMGDPPGIYKSSIYESN